MSRLERFSLLIDGERVAAEGGKTFESLNPATGEPWALMPEASEADVDRAVKAAQRAFESGPWPRMTAGQRGKLLYRLAELVAENAPRFAELETRDTGKLIRETRGLNAYVAEFYRYYAGLADKLEGTIPPIDKPDMLVLARREPLGVVAAVVPWNSQLFLTAVKLGPALAAGNTAVIKGSEHGPAPLLAFGELIEQAGIPPGVVNIVTGFGEPCGRALTRHPLVARLAFTGGPETARHIVRNSAENFAHVTLELGGKSPVMVFEDANMESAVNGVVAGVFGASGQSCVAGTRLLVQERVHEEVVGRLVERAGAIRIGDPLEESSEMGPLATRAQLDRIESSVAATVEAGASLRCGGRRPQSMARGWYYEPTILDCPSAALPSVEQELFGPVLSVLRFRDEAEALRLANDTRYGLAAGIFTRDLARAHRVSAATRAGVVWVNTYRAVSPVVPFGGFKESGLGRECGPEAMLDYTRPKSVWINTSDEPMGDPFVMR